MTKSELDFVLWPQGLSYSDSFVRCLRFIILFINYCFRWMHNFNLRKDWVNLWNKQFNAHYSFVSGRCGFVLCLSSHGKYHSIGSIGEWQDNQTMEKWCVTKGNVICWENVEVLRGSLPLKRILEVAIPFWRNRIRNMEHWD